MDSFQNCSLRLPYQIEIFTVWLLLSTVDPEVPGASP